MDEGLAGTADVPTVLPCSRSRKEVTPRETNTHF